MGKSKRKQSPKLYIVAGPNGAGKTTFAKEFLPQFAHCYEFVNADLIAQGLSPFSPESSVLQAGKILVNRIKVLALSKVDFAFETTLSGRTYLRLLRQFKKDGYQIHLFFLWIPKIHLAIERIKIRVAQGGHDVPRKDVIRRFYRGIQNLFEIYDSVLDSWSIFDNSSGKPVVIAQRSGRKLKIYNNVYYKQLLTLVKNHEKK